MIWFKKSGANKLIISFTPSIYPEFSLLLRQSNKPYRANMKNYKIFYPAIYLLILLNASYAQTDPIIKGLNSITIESLKGQLEFLSSDYTEGRETGTKGNMIAGDYIASLFRIYGIKPAGDIQMKSPSRGDWRKGRRPESVPTYFQNFNLINSEICDDQELSLIKVKDDKKETLSFGYKTDFDIYSSPVSTEFEAPIVFVGYGYKNEDKGYNDFSGVDVKGKLILRLSGFPGIKDTSSAAYKTFKPKDRMAEWGLSRDKNRWAKDAGAIGVIEIIDNKNFPREWIVNLPLRFNTPTYEGETELHAGKYNDMDIPGDTINTKLINCIVTSRVANKIVEEGKISLSGFEKYTAEKMKPASKEIDGIIIRIKSEAKTNLVSTRNILGLIEGEDKDEVIVVGAHYDHVGMGKGYIWNGADDNASGTVGVLALAKAFAESGVKPKKSIMFALWTGEEKGLLGSEYFVNNPPSSIKKILLNLNYDMISRNAPEDSLGRDCSMTYTKAYPVFKELSEKYNSELNLGLNIEFESSERPGGGSDHAPFAEKDIPIFYFMAGFHDDYHKPSDTADKADYKKMMNIIKLGFRNTWDLANDEGLLKEVK
jgi:hypothetical protein